MGRFYHAGLFGLGRYNGGMIEYDSLFGTAAPQPLKDWLSCLPDLVKPRLDPARHGDLTRWLKMLADLPEIPPSTIDLEQSVIQIGAESDCPEAIRSALETALRAFHPWRKGPFRIHDVLIDTEWRSDLKWNRLIHHIAPLPGRTVLDVGCGNGYHCWRMRGAGARLVIGIDPTLLSVMQFHVVKHFAGDHPVHVLPLGIEDMPKELPAFDTVFSMGVLHHRRSPIDHLYDLRGLLRSGGELVLETLVIEGEAGLTLLPEDRYAQMRNVWFLPSPPTLELWVSRCGYRNVRTVDVTVTTSEEQRRTDWMSFHSLADFLDPTDPSLTTEGLPAPRRAIVLAEAP